MPLKSVGILMLMVGFPLLLKGQEGQKEIRINPEAREELNRLFENPFPAKQEKSMFDRLLIEDVMLPRPRAKALKRLPPPLQLNTPRSRWQLNASPKIGLRVYGGFNIDRERPSVTSAMANPLHVGTGVSYQLTKNVELQSGMEYQYNAVWKRWEWVWKTGVVICF